MTTTSAPDSGASEIAILARLLGNGPGRMPAAIARYVLSLGFSDEDKARMHELAVRNQADELSPAEKDEMHGYAKAGSLLGILKSKARRSLGVKPAKRAVS